MERGIANINKKLRKPGEWKSYTLLCLLKVLVKLIELEQINKRLTEELDVP